MKTYPAIPVSNKKYPAHEGHATALKALAISIVSLVSSIAMAQQGVSNDSGSKGIKDDQLSKVMVVDAIAENGEFEARWVKPAERNAAIKYLVAFSNLTPVMSQKMIDINNWETLGFDLDTVNKDATFKAAAEATSGMMPELFVDASLLKKCTFELEYEQGFSLLLPQLGKMRGAARCLRVQARWEAANGKTDLATSYLATMIRMGRHTSNDGFIISSLVGVAVSQLAMAEIRLMAQGGVLTLEDRDELNRLFESLDAKDPMNLVMALNVESKVTHQWIKNRFKGPQAGVDLAAEFFPLTNSTDAEDEIRKQLLERMDEGMIAKDLARMQEAYQATLTAWDAPDAKDQLVAVERRVLDNQYGLLSTLFLPALGKAHTSNVRFIEDITKTIDILKSAKLRDHDAQAVQTP